MTRLAKLCARVMGLIGFTFGIEDVMPTDAIKKVKRPPSTIFTTC